jgi:hypothetical protein
MAKLIVGSGSSRADDTVEAGRAAATAAMAALGETPPGLVVVYSSLAYDLPALLGAIRGVTGDTPLIGASSAGQLLDGEFIPPGSGVMVTVLGSGAYQFSTASVSGLAKDGAGAGRELARAVMAGIEESRPPYEALLVLTDGIASCLEEFALGIHQVMGAAVPLVGGAAGTDTALERTSVLYGDQVIEGGAVGVLIGSDHPLKVVTEHGWQPCSLPLLVTRVDGRVVHEIGGMPAMDVYKADSREDDETFEADRRNKRRPHATHAFGLIQPDGSYLIRGVSVENGQLLTFAPLPPYSAVCVVAGDPDSLFDAAGSVITNALDKVPDPAVVFVFSCVGRMDLYGERAAEEAVRIAAAAGSVSTFGFYTYGEFARITGAGGYHNASLTAVAL